MASRIKNKLVYSSKPISLKDFHSKRNKILFWHDKGGLGDVLIHRMLFEDFKALVPDAELIFACLPEYIPIAEDHPCISKVLDSRTINPNDYIIWYNTCVTIADRYENLHAPCQENRVDIWAAYCGVQLKTHSMCFKLDPELVGKCKEKLKIIAPKQAPVILFSPISKMAAKSLLPWQIDVIVEATKDYNLIGVHKEELSIPGIYHATLKEWMSYFSLADYVISVDTAAFHLAGGLKKPLMGIFTFIDGKVYGKHYDFVLVQKHRDNGNWPCGPCFTFASCPRSNKPLKPCLTELTKEELQAGVVEMLKKWPISEKIN